MKHIIPLLLGATLVGCAGQAPNPTQPVLVSEEPKPEWVTEHKLEDSTTMYFTGISTKYAEERKALKDAKYDALSKFLDYCGLHTKLHEKYISHVNGSTANVLATTNKIETQLETNSEAQVGQFRIVKKHIEIYNGIRGKFYKMYVLASVPKNEVGRVKAWQKENDLQKIAKLKSLNKEQSRLLEETKIEIELLQKRLEELIILREQVSVLTSQKKLLSSENKTLKENTKELNSLRQTNSNLHEKVRKLNLNVTKTSILESKILVLESKLQQKTKESNNWKQAFLDSTKESKVTGFVKNLFN